MTDASLLEEYPDEQDFSVREAGVEGELSGSFPAALELADLDGASASFAGVSAAERQARSPGAQAASGKPLRVVVVGPCLVRGGAEQWLLNFARFVNPRRLRLLRVIVTNPELVDPAFVADLPVPYEAGRSEAIQQAIREAEVLLGWGVGLDQYLGGERPRLCVYVAHGEGEWTRLRLQESLRALDHVVAVSRRVAEAVGTAARTTVIPNGVDSQRLGQSRSRAAVRHALGFAADDFVLGYVGRFSSEKNVDRLIRAAALLPRSFKVLLVGWGRAREALLSLANEQVPGRFALVQAAHYMGDYYQAMDAFCLPSREEGHSLALLEAMMCGRPAIVTPVGAVPEIIVDRVNGVVVSGTEASIAEAALLLRDHPNWARAVGQEARTYAEEHGQSLMMVRRYEELIESLWVGKHAAKP